MVTIQFDESQFKLRSRRILGEPEVPGIIRFLVTKGIVKNENQAVTVLIGLVLIIGGVSVYIIQSGGVQQAKLDPVYSANTL